MTEEWKSVPGYDGKYWVSNLGQIISFVRYPNGKILNIKKITPKGYKRINLNGDYYFIHTLVAKTFIMNPLGLPQVNHKDGNKLNNSVENLEWVTNQENRDHAIKHLLIAHGEKISHFKTEDIVEMRRLYKEGLSQNKIAALFNSTQQTISKIVRREAWKHLKV